jgi:Sulfotransferase domain
MALDVIGSGFGRTGTKSLKAAVEQLGFGPCHHMHEIVENPGQVAHWQALAAGEPVDWNVVFAGYRSQVDWPGAHVWRELAEAFPQAKVIHTVRPEEQWWASFNKTIGKLMARYEALPLPPHIRDILAAWHGLAGQATFGGVLDDREVGLAAFRRRTEEVQEALPADRLLIFDVAEGWDPLCAFLEVEVPDTPFPHHNLRADFWEVLGGEPA